MGFTFVNQLILQILKYTAYLCLALCYLYIGNNNYHSDLLKCNGNL